MSAAVSSTHPPRTQEGVGGARAAETIIKIAAAAAAAAASQRWASSGAPEVCRLQGGYSKQRGLKQPIL